MGNENKKPNEYPIVNQFNQHQWAHIGYIPFGETWQRKQDRMLADVYRVEAEPTPKQLNKYEFRQRNNQYIVGVYNIKIEEKEQMCAESEVMLVLTQHIPQRLRNLTGITQHEGFTILKSAFIGFNIIASMDGLVEPHDNLICFNSEGKPKVWLNGFIASNDPEEFPYEIQRTNSASTHSIKHVNALYIRKICSIVLKKMHTTNLIQPLIQQLIKFDELSYFQASNLVIDYANANKIRIHPIIYLRAGQSTVLNSGPFFNQKKYEPVSSQSHKVTPQPHKVSSESHKVSPQYQSHQRVQSNTRNQSHRNADRSDSTLEMAHQPLENTGIRRFPGEISQFDLISKRKKHSPIKKKNIASKFEGFNMLEFMQDKKESDHIDSRVQTQVENKLRGFSLSNQIKKPRKQSKEDLRILQERSIQMPKIKIESKSLIYELDAIAQSSKYIDWEAGSLQPNKNARDDLDNMATREQFYTNNNVNINNNTNINLAKSVSKLQYIKGSHTPNCRSIPNLNLTNLNRTVQKPQVRAKVINLKEEKYGLRKKRYPHQSRPN